MTTPFTFIPFVAALASCNASASTPGSGSSAYTDACYVSAGGLQYRQRVIEYRGPLGGQTLTASCATQGGTYTATCSSAGRAGRCTVDNGLSLQVMDYYGSTADVVRSLCASFRGTFEAG